MEANTDSRIPPPNRPRWRQDHPTHRSPLRGTQELRARCRDLRQGPFLLGEGGCQHLWGFASSVKCSWAVWN